MPCSVERAVRSVESKPDFCHRLLYSRRRTWLFGDPVCSPAPHSRPQTSSRRRPAAAAARRTQHSRCPCRGSPSPFGLGPPNLLFFPSRTPTAPASDKPLKLPEIVREGLRQRDQLHQCLLSAVEPDLDPPRTDRHTGREASKPGLEVDDATRFTEAFTHLLRAPAPNGRSSSSNVPPRPAHRRHTRRELYLAGWVASLLCRGNCGTWRCCAATCRSDPAEVLQSMPDTRDPQEQSSRNSHRFLGSVLHSLPGQTLDRLVKRRVSATMATRNKFSQ